MVNKNYRIGRSFEYRVQAYLRKRGFYVVRQYASKGLVDLVAIYPSNGDFYNLTLMIQCKSNGYVPPDEMKKLLECEKRWQGWIIIAYKDENKHIAFRTLNGQKLSNDFPTI